jgi:hypothetical protein
VVLHVFLSSIYPEGLGYSLMSSPRLLILCPPPPLLLIKLQCPLLQQMIRQHDDVPCRSKTEKQKRTWQDYSDPSKEEQPIISLGMLPHILGFNRGDSNCPSKPPRCCTYHMLQRNSTCNTDTVLRALRRSRTKVGGNVTYRV